ncbi:hypothetical protein ABZ312_11660 [Streptomyces sp. NPDC006207]
MDRIRHARLRLATTGGPLGATPVEIADQTTTTNDLRIALNAARGIPLDDLDPTTGHVKEAS